MLLPNGWTCAIVLVITIEAGSSEVLFDDDQPMVVGHQLVVGDDVLIVEELADLELAPQLAQV